MKQIINFFKDEDGAAIPEYALILGVVAAVAIGTLMTIGTQSVNIFTEVGDSLTDAETQAAGGAGEGDATTP